MRTALAWYIRMGTKRAKLASGPRRVTSWCDYEGAHRHVKWEATVDGVPFGQSCTRHVGALLVDAQRKGHAVIEPIAGDEPRTTRVCVS
jgi:hypothetical protein